MARGDVVSDIQTIATGANLDFQPAAGVEVMITEIGSSSIIGSAPDGAPEVIVQLYNGTLASTLRYSTLSARLWGREMKILLNNTRYLRINNLNASSRNLCYCGVQTK